MTISPIRSALVAEAMGWLKTPYHHQGDQKGAGVDCVMLLVRVYQPFGLLPANYDPRPYVPDWHLHRDAEKYLHGLLQHGRHVDRPQPGDVAVYRFGRTYSHGAIVLDWPTVIHAHRRDGAVVLSDGSAGDLAGRQVIFFSLVGD